MKIFKMKIYLIITLFLALFIIGFDLLQAGEKEVSLWPEIEPYKTGYLKVSEIHDIYYELCGNPQGKPVFVLHGGPGGSALPYFRCFFNPKKFLIVLYDQRGCGKSRPFAELRENTTQHLVEDIEKLRQYLKVKKLIVFGGSWGTTLGLAYSQAYPENVMAIVLRGVFTATKAEVDHYYNGVRTFFPSVLARLQKALSSPPTPELIYRLVKNGDSKEREKYSRAWTRFEFAISKLEISAWEVERLLRRPDLAKFVYSLALFENYYLANGCFLKEGELLRNADRIRDIPTVIVNGRYDMICPPVTAYNLHKRLSNSKLLIIEGAGHSMMEKSIEKALLTAMREFE